MNIWTRIEVQRSSPGAEVYNKNVVYFVKKFMMDVEVLALGFGMLPIEISDGLKISISGFSTK